MEHLIDELAKLQELKEKGAVTDEEFDLAKADILDQIAAHEEGVTVQLIPPPPESPSQKRKRAILISTAILVAATLGVGAWMFFGRSDGPPASVKVVYSLEVVTTDYCANFAATGYSDIPYAEAEIVDGSGNLLGSGTLDGGIDLDASCVFSAEFTIDGSPDGKYRATAGNNNRGFLNYSEADVIEGVLEVYATIGG